MPSAKPLVSIVTCCYNCEKYVATCLESVLGQTYDNIEFIFVDDGSEDKSFEIAQSYVEPFRQRGYRIIVTRQTNQGPGYAAINGLKLATGEYWSYLDADDNLLPESVQVRAEALIADPSLTVVRTNGYKVIESTGEKSILITDKRDKSSYDLFNDLIEGVANNFAGTFMVRSSAVKAYYGKNDIPYSDYGQNIQLILPAAYHGKCRFIDKPLMQYIHHGVTHSHRKTLADKLAILQGYLDVREQVLKYCTDDISEAMRRAKIWSARAILDTVLGSINDPQAMQWFEQWYKKLAELDGLDIEMRMHHARINSSTCYPLYKILFAIKRRFFR